MNEINTKSDEFLIRALIECVKQVCHMEMNPDSDEASTQEMRQHVEDLRSELLRRLW